MGCMYFEKGLSVENNKHEIPNFGQIYPFFAQCFYIEAFPQYPCSLSKYSRKFDI